MKKLKLIISTSLCTLSVFSLTVWAENAIAKYYQPYSGEQVAKLLNWVPGWQAHCLCPGYFKIPQNIINHPHPLPWDQLPTRITAKGPSVLSQSGTTALNKDVVLTQPGRIVKANHAKIYRNKKRQVVRVNLKGDVHLREPDRLLTGKTASMNLQTHAAHITDAAYYLKRYHVVNTSGDPVAGWGTAQSIKQLPNRIIILKHATYSTCSPLNPTWKIQAAKITLNKNTDQGHAKHVIFKIKNMPIFYFPYFSFPIGNKRKSGFLYPSFGYSNRRGFDVKIPIYWNMAPNYDSTWTIWPMTSRGVLFSTFFRYLSQHSLGDLYVSVIPDDQGFIRFKRDMNNRYNPVPANYAPFLNQLNNDSNTRAFFSLNDKVKFNDYWSAHAIINYVTDAYYFNDFGLDYGQVAANQLLNEVDLNYQGTHWTFHAMAQGFQTLHQIDQVGTITTFNQYTRAPEFDFNTYYPDLGGGLDFSMDTELTNFLYSSSFTPQTFSQAIGWRLHARPGLMRPFDWAGGYITPAIYLDSTSYFAEMPAAAANIPRTDINASRNIPIVDVDSGLYTDRDFIIDGQRYIQTFEPRLFYLFVPYVNQNRYPNFDGEELPFSFPQLFALNRFTGFDRLQNANQISLGVTSKILSGYDNAEKLKAELGVIYYFSQPKVTLPGGTPSPDQRWSPIIGSLDYTPTSHWDIHTAIAVDPDAGTLNNSISNAEATINYKPSKNRVLSLGYQYIQDVEGINIGRTDLIKAGAAWPIGHHFSALGYVYYDFRRNLALTYFGGLQYDTCCVAIRAVVSRSFTGIDTDSAGNPLKNRYSTNYYIQIMFKGLGEIGNADPSSLIGQGLPGYFDPFASH